VAAACGSSGVDEFGRDLGLQRRQELQRGAGRRQRLVGGLMQQMATLQQGELEGLGAGVREQHCTKVTLQGCVVAVVMVGEAGAGVWAESSTAAR